jgi:hypothetical protein
MQHNERTYELQQNLRIGTENALFSMRSRSDRLRTAADVNQIRTSQWIAWTGLSLDQESKVDKEER